MTGYVTGTLTDDDGAAELLARPSSRSPSPSGLAAPG